MKKIIVCAALALSLGACQSNNPGDRAVAGGLVGAGAGAVVGGLATGRAGGALAGAAIGGAGGAILGASTAPAPAWCRGYDDYGRPYRYRC